MSKSKNDFVDPDDFFAETKMSFGDHIEDLRKHLISAIKGFLICLVGAFFIAKPILSFIRAPVERQLIAFWDRYQEAKEKEILETKVEGNTGSPTMVLRVNKDDYKKFPPVEELEKRVAFLEKKILGKEGLPPELANTGPVFNPIPAFERVLEQLDVGDLINPDLFPEYSAYAKIRVQWDNGLEHASMEERYRTKIRPPVLTVLNVTEGLMVWAKVAIMTGFVLGSPWIFYQMWMFIAAGLYPHEKKYVNLYLPFSLGLFLGGVLICEFFVMDKAIEALLWFNEFLGLVPELRLSEWLGFAIFMPLVFGLSFQTPLVMLFIQRIGLVKTETFRKHWRIIWFLMAVFAAVITPSVDPVSMLLLWVPMVLLFELGIYLCKLMPGQPLLDFDVPETEETVEV